MQNIRMYKIDPTVQRGFHLYTQNFIRKQTKSGNGKYRQRLSSNKKYFFRMHSEFI